MSVFFLFIAGNRRAREEKNSRCIVGNYILGLVERYKKSVGNSSF